MLAVFAQPAPAQVSEAEIKACHATPDTRCLADIGTALILAEDAPDSTLSGASLLAQLGRLDEAYSTELKFRLGKGLSDARAHATAGYLVAPFRLMEALRNGVADDVLSADADAPDIALDTALARLAGMTATNTMLGIRPTQDAATLSILRQILLQRGGTRERRLDAAAILAYVGTAVGIARAEVRRRVGVRAHTSAKWTRCARSSTR